MLFKKMNAQSADNTSETGRRRRRKGRINSKS
jgi:hypothetical protein